MSCSSAGRWRAHRALQSPKQILQILFGSSDIRVGLLFQGHLRGLSKHLPRLPSNLPLALAKQMTLINYYMSTAIPAKRQEVLSALVAGDYGWVACELGLSASAVRPPSNLKFCPQCTANDLSARGETCWRRAHQLPGVLVCHVHGGPLLEVAWKARSVAQHVFPVLEARDVRKPFKVPSWTQKRSTHRFLFQIAKRSAALLITTTTKDQRTQTGEDWRTAIRDRGFSKGTKNLDRVAILDAYEDFISPVSEILPEAKAGPWLNAISRKHRKAINPLHHILMMMFVESLPLQAASNPFGLGPWPCQNPLEKHFGNITIGKVKVHTDSGKTIGRFGCECGHEYSQSAGGGRVVVYNYGREFDKVLSECVTGGSGLRATARRLHVDPLTVRRHAHRLGLSTPWKPIEKRANEGPSQTSERRKRWFALKQQFPEATSTQLRRLNPADWTWLSRNDRDWLKHQSPASPKTTSAKPRFDWPKIDQEMQHLVINAANSVRASKPLRRITITAIERQIGMPDYFRSRARKLPQTFSTLCSMVETVAKFQCRRINYLAVEMMKDRDDVKEWEIRRAAGLGASTTKDAADLLALFERFKFEARKSAL
jgi:hypothetical protein